MGGGQVLAQIATVGEQGRTRVIFKLILILD